MNEWESVKLADIIDLFDQKRVPLSSVQRASRKGPFPYYGAQGVIDYIDDYIFDGRYMLVPEDGENLRSRKLPIAYFAEGRFWVNNHAHVIKAKPGLAVDRFVQSALESTNIAAWVTGTAQPKLSQANLLAIEVKLPSYIEQEAISNILDAFDKLIENNRRRVAILEEIARAIYREWFVKFRYPGHEDVPIVGSALGPIPEGWAVTNLGNALQLRYGKALKADDRAGGDVAVVGSAGVVGWHSTRLIDGPAIVIGRKGNVGSVVWLDGPSWPIDTTYYVETELPLRFVAEQLRGIEFTNSHAAVPGLSREGAYARPFLIPPAQLLASFQAVVDPLGVNATRLHQQSVTLRALRDLILPKLVTGQIDVSTLGLSPHD